MNRKYFGLYYIKGATPELCEVDGGVCYEAHRNEKKALARITICNLNSQEYAVMQIPRGIKVFDCKTDQVAISG